MVNNNLVTLENNNVICEIPYKNNLYIAFTNEDIYNDDDEFANVSFAKKVKVDDKINTLVEIEDDIYKELLNMFKKIMESIGDEDE